MEEKINKDLFENKIENEKPDEVIEHNKDQKNNEDKDGSSMPDGFNVTVGDIYPN